MSEKPNFLPLHWVAAHGMVLGFSTGWSFFGFLVWADTVVRNTKNTNGQSGLIATTVIAGIVLTAGSLWAWWEYETWRIKTHKTREARIADLESKAFDA